ncbi:MAG: 50S ribosomal protein L30 [Turicibacter sp.]|nr:50S ribosomal protein L30 [Turicibacter sp.]
MAKELHITLKRSVIGQTDSQRATVHALGLRKTSQTVVKTDNERIRGMINKVSHLLAVEEK